MAFLWSSLISLIPMGEDQCMLFDLKTDTDENKNVAENTKYKATINRIKQLLYKKNNFLK